MSDNKFIKRLKGEQTAKSVLEIKNESAKTSFANMPQGTSNAIDVFSDYRGNATAVLNGTTNWKVSNSDLLLVDAVSGDGQDFTSTYSVAGAGLWVNASYTFPSTGDPRHPVAMVFNPSTKWVLKVCGDNLIVDGGSTVNFTMLVKIGTSNVYSKNFTIRESAGQFSKEFIIDFGEANSDVVKVGGLSTLTVQLLCGTANASARIYNGMTVLTCLQRKVDASAVSTSFANVEEALQDGMLPSDYFNNAAFIDQVEDGDKAYAVFQRDGDEINLAGWDEPIPSQTGNSGKYLTTDGSDMSWHQITASDVGALPDSTKYGASFSLSMNSSTFVITAQLKDQDGNNLGSAQTIDLPLESVVVNGSYDNETKSLILTLENGNTITIPVADLIAGLQSEITAQNPLDADLVSDSTSAHKFVSATEKTNWNNHIANTNNPHQVTKAQVGLGNVDNTSDLNKPISTATQTALNAKANTADLATVATSGSYNDLSNKPTIPTVDQTYDATSANAQSGVAINGANFLVNNAADSTNGVAIKGSGKVQSTQIGALGSAVSMSTSVGFSCFASGTQSIAIGHGSQATASKSYVFGEQAKSTAIGAFQFGQATNNEAGSVYFGLTTDGSTTTNYKLLGSDGLIPDARISSNIARTSDLATVATSGSYNDLSNKPTIPTVNNPTITITQGGVTKGSFSLNQATGDTIALDAGGGGGSADIDNLTITENADQEIQAVAVIDQNTGIAKTWTGTMAEYEAIVTKDPETEYIITDDIGGSATEIGEITEALNGKVDKGHQVIEFQEPTSSNNYTWYRKYADGWVEQGGYATTNSGNPKQITLPLEMANIYYNINITSQTLTDGYANAAWNVIAINTTASPKTNTKFYAQPSITGYNLPFYWVVFGMAA